MPAQRPFDGHAHPVEHIELLDEEEEEQREVEHPDNRPNPLPLQIKDTLDSHLPGLVFSTWTDHWNKTFWQLAKKDIDDMVFTQLCNIDLILRIIKHDFPIRPTANVQYYMFPNLSYTLTLHLHLPPVRVPTNGDEVAPEDLVDFDPDQLLFDFEATLRQGALVRLLKDFVLEEIDQNGWYVDVTSSISIAEHDGHPLCTLIDQGLH
ncbi:hypothetical protein FRC06_004823 [Ceratobasidium sp. 370]|nr:hypothetical protein FRC06_004823 [Ceratobasidium sp. 370]